MKTITSGYLSVSGIAALFFASTALAQVEDGKPITATVEGHVFKPARVPATEERIKQLKVPEGFEITKFAEGLNKPRMIAVTASGLVYVTDRDQGTVTLLRDENKDGVSESSQEVAQKKQLHGIALRNDQVYLATVNEVFVADIRDDGSFGELKRIIKDLPDGGQHGNRTLEFGPDGMLYISIGSTCNACTETNDENATILKAKPDGSSRTIFAKGLRNTLGFAWHPETGQVWGMDHGIDWLGDEEQREELNLLEEGADYGWPYIYGEGKENPADQPPASSYDEYKKKTKYPVLTYTAHSSGLDMIFYDGKQFPEAYNGDAFVAFHGSWNRQTPVGYKVARIRYENGQPKAFEDFVTGFLLEDEKSQFGRVVGLATYTDGSLLITDDSNGVVYRVAYVGDTDG
ncbi:PQQ-dependent sugar dehydrogenase [Allohahella marinimesophila]|uniref:Sorbosone dehydrogenase family protein n=1 Tax=Allohahella marinimesophila TaxID=1054972 RepID=A0ABP7Q2G2_9GAMM